MSLMSNNNSTGSGVGPFLTLCNLSLKHHHRCIILCVLFEDGSPQIPLPLLIAAYILYYYYYYYYIHTTIRGRQAGRHAGLRYTAHFGAHSYLLRTIFCALGNLYCLFPFLSSLLHWCSSSFFLFPLFSAIYALSLLCQVLKSDTLLLLALPFDTLFADIRYGSFSLLRSQALISSVVIFPSCIEIGIRSTY